ncbi:hypothetical protein [Brevibacillus sp. HD1.4A]|uniref:hypothetical protein n=1 Tax=Brevibacillus sp. HD1.4A TaxID=2738978 RepID=UPI00156AA63E|nr:hypothetical protein [Brevibacillus sp. HD1.4A]NRQ56080.1 hypothetical protein [Brevibacillus sp. HD1.4A]
MSKEEYNLIETIGGKWVKVAKGVGSGTFNMEFENVLLCIHVGNKNIAFHAKDETETYQYLGDVSFDSDNQNELNINFFTTALEKIMVGRDRAEILNPFAKISRFEMKFTKDQKEKWMADKKLDF